MAVKITYFVHGTTTDNQQFGQSKELEKEIMKHLNKQGS